MADNLIVQPTVRFSFIQKIHTINSLRASFRRIHLPRKTAGMRLYNNLGVDNLCLQKNPSLNTSDSEPRRTAVVTHSSLFKHFPFPLPVIEPFEPGHLPLYTLDLVDLHSTIYVDLPE